MANYNLRKKIIECKIVYYGPGRCGKTTNLKCIFDRFRNKTMGEMVSINTKGDRTLFFDFLPLGLGKIHGCDVKVQLFTVPGQPKYISTRKMVLKNVDGIVFVADSLKARQAENIWALKDLEQNLSEQNKDIYDIPLIFQYNKRDLDAEGMPMIPVKSMDFDLNDKLKVPFFRASAVSGKGVGATLKNCLKVTLKQLHRELTCFN
jgi:signal recognition particle receptor subunit beta